MIAPGILMVLAGWVTFAAPAQTQETLFSALPLEAPAPADNPTTRLRVELGRLLFWDPILSGSGDVACATCHHPDFGYADGRDLPIGVGGTGLAHARRFSSAGGRRLVKRNSQSLLNVAFNGWTDARPFPPGAAPMFWDVRARGLEERVRLVEETCLGHCLRGPNVLVQEEGSDVDFGGVLYNRMTLEDLDRVIDRHLVGGMAVRVLMNRPPIRDK